MRAASTSTAGSAVLKDLVGETQFLLIPTARSSGIDDPAILAPTAPNYFAAAWRAKSFVDERAGVELPRQWMSLAINSAYARSQNQLHIHVDCVRPDVHDALTEHGSAVGPAWAPFPVELAGHRYDAMSVDGDDLGRPTRSTCWPTGWRARARTWPLERWWWWARKTPTGDRVSSILTDRADAATGDQAAGEELQDHDFCPRVAATLPGK